MSWLDDLLDASTASKHSDQGSEDWENIRAGRFTSSDFWKLMICGTRPMTPEELKARPKTGKGSKTTTVPDPSKMGEKGVTYIRQKVAEVLTGQPKQAAYAYPLVYGKETEPEAVEYFQEKTGLQCEQIGFITWGDHAGCSPDRLIGDDEILEVKCPYQSENQIDYLMLTDIWDVKALYPQYYWQVVTQLLFTQRKRAHFCTYDPRMQNDKHKLTHIIFEWEKVEDDADLAIKALEGAIKEKLHLLSILNK